MTRTLHLLSAAALVAGLAACGERPQSEPAPIKKHDAKAATGTDNGYAASGWTAGDETSWANQLKARAQGQNEYTRSAAAPKTP